jgi:hypothetical protein
MPREADPNAGQSVDLVFTDDLEGTVFEVRRDPPIYTAEEVREKTGNDVPEFGDWVAVYLPGPDAEGWMVAVSELEQWVARTENVTARTYEVTKCQKTGSSQTDPYEVQVETITDSGQASL